MIMETGTDELERLAIEEIVKRGRLSGQVTALVLPAGKGDLAIQMARLGARVVAADVAENARNFQGRALSAGVRDETSFTALPADGLPESFSGEPFDVIFVRPGLLCRFPYPQARAFVRQLLLKLKIGGKLHLSLYGMHSELAEGYTCREALLEDRYGELDPDIAAKYGIHGKICLYSERQLFLMLMEAGASVLRTFTTTHGNVKGVAVRV